MTYVDPRVATQATDISSLQSELTDVTGVLDGKADIYVQSTQPTGLATDDKGDIWINDGATPRVIKTWTGTAWIDADSRITQAVTDIAKKTTTYYVSTAPTVGLTTGDLWINTAAGKNNELSRWSGSVWQTIVDPRIAASAPHCWKWRT